MVTTLKQSAKVCVSVASYLYSRCMTVSTAACWADGDGSWSGALPGSTGFADCAPLREASRYSRSISGFGVRSDLLEVSGRCGSPVTPQLFMRLRQLQRVLEPVQGLLLRGHLNVGIV